MPAADIVVLGVRHHGPGSGRSVRRALERLAPAAVVVEGPPELGAVIPFLAEPGMSPPVAGLVYDVAQPRRAAFYPLASFSPEWVALQWALANGVPASFADLPASNRFAIDAAGPASASEPAENQAPPTPPAPAAPAAVPAEGPETPAPAAPAAVPAEGPETPAPMAPTEAAEEPEDPAPATAAGGAARKRVAVTADPIGTLAGLAGYDDAERWWEDAVEQRAPDDPLAQFASVNDAMTAYREHAAVLPDLPGEHNAQREASMRKILRKLRKQTGGVIAVVCGAFHAPALQPEAWPSATADNGLLKGLPRTKVAATWAPWTTERLAYTSGYGAGVTAPGWYEHLFHCREDVVPTWMVRTASLLREERFDAPPASVVEATRLAEALAALRGRPLAGVSEVIDASTTVLGHGHSDGLDVIAHRLWVGDVLGTVPAETPTVPLAEDLARQQRSLRLKPSAEQKAITLDLRTASHRHRSALFRRLELLGVPWGVEAATGRTGGTFKEVWTLEWQPEFAVAVIEASLHGTTVETAAAAKAVSLAREADSLATLSGLVEVCLLAEIGDALGDILRLLANRAAEQSDQLQVMQTIEPLARSVRYGSVRQLDTADLRAALETLVRRSAIGLPAACAALDDDAALATRAAIEAIDRSVALLAGDENDADLAVRWRRSMAGLSETSVHGLVIGRVSRLLLDAGVIDGDEAADRLSRALSIARSPANAAGWLDGFIAGDAALLLHDRRLFTMIDDWLTRLDAATFDDLLPIVRRSFAVFEKGERRQLGDLVARGSDQSATVVDEIDIELARPAVEKVAALLGLEVTR
jgi:hypothetical protein